MTLSEQTRNYRFFELCNRCGLRESAASFGRAVMSSPVHNPELDRRHHGLFRLADWQGVLEAGGLEPSSLGDAHEDVRSFVEEFMALYDEGSDQERRKLEDDLRSAFSTGFAPLDHQLRVARWFRRAGFSLTIADADSAAKAPDFLAAQGELQFEIECKTFSVDAGRTITTTNVEDIVARCKRELDRSNATMPVQAVVLVEMDDRIPQQTNRRAGLAAACLSVARGVEAASNLPFKISRLPSGYPDPRDHERFSRWLDETLGRGWRRGDLLNGDAYIVLIVRSNRPNSILRALEKRLRQAKSEQLSGRRPAILAIRLEGVSETELAELGSNSDLSVMVSHFFRKNSRVFIRGVLYFPDPATEDGSSWCRWPGRALAFWNPRSSPFRGPDLIGLLGRSASPGERSGAVEE
jgi:hypothetical protein